MSKVSKSWSLKVAAFVAVSSLFTLFVLVAAHSIDFYSPADGVVELTGSDFESMVLQDDAIWIVQFYAPWCSHCQAMLPEYKRLAKALRGVIKLGAVNSERHTELTAKYEIRGFPLIKIFGADKQKPTDFFGPRTAQAMAELAVAEVKKKVKAAFGERLDVATDAARNSVCSASEVTELRADNFDRLVLNSADIWLVEFYTPWCPHCKNLAATWIEAARELKGKIKLGALDASANKHKAAEHNVRSYPTIKYFPAQSKQPADAVVYTGQRTAAAIVSWANSKPVAPAPNVAEITDESSLFNACGHRSWCVISVLPTLLDCNARCRNKLLGTLRGLCAKYPAQQGWGWVWTEGGQQPALEKGLRVGGFGYPALVVVNCRRMRYAVFKGSFSEAALDEFLGDIVRGRGRTSTVNCAQKPPIRSVIGWDGQDAVAERSITDEL
ncbi:protein disulfide-isomerase A6 homolog [Drosophila montana]|uniref:protein disulfide-isomerase A6 homolog n=1 Tax=Drosophila montana TaxID=40370 RepID=UPI00313C6A49